MSFDEPHPGQRAQSLGVCDSSESSDDGDGLALLQPESGQYFTLNQTGATVWHLLKEPHSIGEITLAVADKYAVAALECQDDIQEIITRLGDAGLIHKA